MLGTVGQDSREQAIKESIKNEEELLAVPWEKQILAAPSKYTAVYTPTH